MNLEKSIRVAAVSWALCSPAFLSPQTPNPSKMRVTVERKDGSAWRAMDPRHVFAQGDVVRFRFSSGFRGYLYVMNQSTSGRYETLFPRADTGAQNAVEPGKEYVVPATQGWFRISGPPGQDVMYWLISPVELDGERQPYRPLPPPPAADAPKSMRPRCDDAIFKSRGECIDTSAGPRPVGDSLPGNLEGRADAAKSRELLFLQDKSGTTVSSAAPLTGPVIYEFRLAHN